MTHCIMVLAEANDPSIFTEALTQGQLSDGFHGQDQLVGTQRGMLILWVAFPLPNKLIHQLTKHRVSAIKFSKSEKHLSQSTFRTRGKLFFSVVSMAP